MEFRQIRYFIEVARAGSFVRAARSLGLTQPALSRQIGLLERETGRELFDRSGRDIRLTPAGERLLEKATRLQDMWREMLHALDEEEGEPAGEYAISAGGTVATYILPGVLRRVRDAHPRANFRVFEGDAHQTAEALRNAEVDLGILTGPIPAADFHAREFLKDRIVPVVARDDPLATKKRVTVDHLRDKDFVFYHSASAIRQVMERRFRAVKPRFRPRISMELRNVESVIRSVEAGLGAGFVSEFALTDGLRVLNIPELVGERDFYLCFRGNRPGLPPLLKSIEEAAAVRRLS